MRVLPLKLNQCCPQKPLRFFLAKIYKVLNWLEPLKNIYAICCGIAHAKLVGENALGFIVTRSMAEMSRFAVAKGANPITFLGLGRHG
jgi:glycerol-3-phosphate dehydrogenase